MWLGRLFRRRDTRLLAIFPGGLVASAFFLFSAGESGWHPLPQALLSCMVWCVIATWIVRLRRHLPPDMDLIPVSAQTEIRSEPDATLLHVRVDSDPLRRGRLDILIDDRPVAQLLPGTGCVLPLPRGPHTLTMMLFSRRVRSTFSISALSGVRIGYRVRVFGTRPPQLIVTPETDMPAGTRLVHCVAAA